MSVGLWRFESVPCYQMGDKPYKVAERYTVPDEHRHEILRELHENGPMKPWTLLSRVDAPHKAMKQLALDWEIRVTADGDIDLPRR